MRSPWVDGEAEQPVWDDWHRSQLWDTEELIELLEHEQDAVADPAVVRWLRSRRQADDIVG